LLVQEKVDPKGVQFGKKPNKVLQAAAKPIHRPGRHHSEGAACNPRLQVSLQFDDCLPRLSKDV
jgi:hypothetical protein